MRARYNIANSTLYRWVEQGLLPPPVKLVPGGKAAGWPEEEIDARDKALIANQRKALGKS